MKMKFKRAIYIGVPILVALYFMGRSNQSLPRTFLIPSDYQGTLRIIYDEKCGIKPKEENGREIFEFQNNGLVILTTANDYRIKNDFYLVDATGKRTKVNQISAFADRVNKMPAILAGGEMVSSSVVNSVNSESTRLAGGADCMDFSLYNKDTTKIEDSKLSQKLDFLTNSVVNACRESK